MELFREMRGMKRIWQGTAPPKVIAPGISTASSRSFVRQLTDERTSSSCCYPLRGFFLLFAEPPQGAATVNSIKNDKILDLAVESGLKSLFIGFESLDQAGLLKQNKKHNRTDEYEEIVKKLHEKTVMINASFVFGLDGDTTGTFLSTSEWAVRNAIETATFHILTPYPGTRLFKRYEAEKRIISKDWNLYDTRHLVFKHPVMSKTELEEGYAAAYEYFYRWSSIYRAASAQNNLISSLRHFAYTGAWKKFEWFWNILIKLKRLDLAMNPLEKILGCGAINKEKQIKLTSGVSEE